MLPKLLLLFVVLTWGPVRTYRETNRRPQKGEFVARALDAGEVVVTVYKIKNQEGKMVVCLFKNRDGFPAEMDKVAIKQAVTIVGTTAQLTLKNVPPGDYYLSVFHDANNNGKPDRNFIGLPKEGVGLANDDMKAMKPNFANALIHVRPGSQVVAIQLRYLF